MHHSLCTTPGSLDSTWQHSSGLPNSICLRMTCTYASACKHDPASCQGFLSPEHQALQAQCSEVHGLPCRTWQRVHALHMDDPALLVRRLLTSGARRAAAQVAARPELVAALSNGLPHSAERSSGCVLALAVVQSCAPCAQTINLCCGLRPCLP